MLLIQLDQYDSIAGVYWSTSQVVGTSEGKQPVLVNYVLEHCLCLWILASSFTLRS